MSNFNIKRFIHTLKWSMLATKKEITTIAGCMFFLYLMPFIISVMSSHGKLDIIAESDIQSAAIVCINYLAVFLMIGGCWILNNMKTKEQRITFKMLPASDLEKYLARVIYITVVWFAIGILTFCLADICRMLICLISGTHGAHSIIPYAFNIINHIEMTERGIDHYLIYAFNIIFIDDHIEMTERDMDYYLIIASIYGWVFWAHSLYVLGGAFFRRRQFILTSCVHFLLGFIALFLSRYKGSVIIDPDDTHINVLLCIYPFIAFAIALFNWWLAYKLFKRSQVINNKWINL